MKHQTRSFIFISIVLILLGLFSLQPNALQNSYAAAGDISTVVGGGGSDGMPATETSVGKVKALAMDGEGNLLIGDETAERILMIDENGIVSTIAGTGFGFSGDGGPAVDAQIGWPSGIFVDSSGNIFIADQSNRRVRKVDTSGIITTVAGNGEFASNGDGGPATDASVSPDDVAVDEAGNLFIADFRHHRIRKVAPNGTISTIAGNGTPGYNGDGILATAAQLNTPRAITVDNDGNILITDTMNRRIRKIDSNGIISTIAGTGQFGGSGNGGPATAARLSTPSDIVVDSAGTIFIADEQNNRIRSIDQNGIIRNVAGNGTYGFGGDGGPAKSALLGNPLGVAVDPTGTVFIADTESQRVRRVDTNGIIITVAGNGLRSFGGDGGPAIDAKLDDPLEATFDREGNMYIADRWNHRVRRVDTNGVITTVAGNGTPVFSGDGGLATTASLRFPVSVAVDQEGNIYIADLSNKRIRKVDTNGIITTFAGTGSGFSGDGGPAVDAHIGGPTEVEVDRFGNVFFSSTATGRVRKVDRNGIITTVAGNGVLGFSGDGGLATEASIWPGSLAFDAAGNLFITGGNRIRKVDTNGIITTVAGDGSEDLAEDGAIATESGLYIPSGIAIDAEGNLFISVRGHQRIQKVDTNGIISTIAGTGQYGFSGDGGPAIFAHMWNPGGLTIDSGGNLFFADIVHNRIRKIENVAAASSPQPTITIVQDAQPASNTNFRFGGNLGTFRLDDPETDDGDSFTDSQTFTVDDRSYVIRQQVFMNWSLAEINCSPSSNAVVDLSKNKVTIDVVEGEDVTCTFVNQRRGEIHARKFNDLNADGGYSNNEPWMEGWTMELYDKQQLGYPSVTQETAANGRADFFKVAAGDYAVCEVEQSGWTHTRPSTLDSQFGQPCYNVTLQSGQALWMRFGNSQTQPLRGATMSDLNEVVVTLLPDTDEDGNVIEDAIDPFVPKTNATERNNLVFLPFVR